MFFAKSTGGFYDTRIHGDHIPIGSVEISDEQRLALLAGESARKIITTAADGKPILADLAKDTSSQVWERIKAERDRRQIDGGVQVGDHWFLSTDRATSEYNTIVNTTRGIPETTIVRAGWRTMDGTEVDMTPALALQILTAGIARRCAIDDAAQTHKAAMEAVVDPSSYDFSAGWPKVFGE
jgi:hypothetical protein